MPRDVATKCTFPHASHMTPMWIGMPADYGTISPQRVSGQLSTIGALEGSFGEAEEKTGCVFPLNARRLWFPLFAEVEKPDPSGHHPSYSFALLVSVTYVTARCDKRYVPVAMTTSATLAA
jgi:hypothetical protein